MWTRITYFSRETAISLRRNLLMTLAGILTVAVSLALFGGILVISLILLASSLFLIVNTIRLATFARRREIEVMKLVGASNWFVRVPFVAEGLVQGAIGAGISVGLVYV